MKRIVMGAAAAALSVAAVGLATAGAAGATGRAAMSKPSAQDVKWMRSNGQTDLTEIAAGKLVLAKSGNAPTRQLAKVTKRQHAMVLVKLTKLAHGSGVTLPKTPNAMQRKQAAALKKLGGLTFDRAYDKAQIAGHKQSISQTKLEIKRGTSSTVVAFAKHYLPVAEMHLKMAEKLKGQITPP
jgi:putative membrane protein